MKPKKGEKALQGKKAQIMKLVENAVLTIRLPAQKPVYRPLKELPPPRAALAISSPEPRPKTLLVRLPAQPPFRTPLKCSPVKFLDLPGEVRNKIYGYAFTKEFFSIGWAEPSSTSMKINVRSLTYSLPKRPKNKSPQLAPGVCRRRRLFDLPRRLRSSEAIPPYQLSPGPAALLLTCKTVNREATPLFYGNSTFTFHSQTIFQRFLDTIGTSSKASIRSMHLKHYTAGHPFYRPHEWMKATYDDKWDDLCVQAAAELTSLEELSIDLTINDVPIAFTYHEKWMASLLEFEQCPLKRCSVRLHNSTAGDAVLEVEEYKLRKELLGDAFVEGWRGESGWNRKRIHHGQPTKILNICLYN